MPRRAPGVLWAEDSLQDQILIREALADLGGGHQVTFVGDGLRLLDALKEGTPALVALDLRMPRLGGLEALRRIRADPAWRALPVCIFSAGHQPDEVRECQALEALEIVQKPIDFDEFTQAVGRILRHAP